MKDALAPTLTIRNEHGCEIFYNFAYTPWMMPGAGLQSIPPGLSDKGCLCRSPHHDHVLDVM